MVSAPTPEAMLFELRCTVTKGVPVPVGAVRVPERRERYSDGRLSTALNECRFPTRVGDYVSVSQVASAGNDVFRQYATDKKDTPLVPTLFYPHPVQESK